MTVVVIVSDKHLFVCCVVVSEPYLKIKTFSI